MVAGGAGYIGSHVAEALLREGISVLIVDNLSTGHQSAVDELRTRYHRDQGPQLNFAQLDVRDTASLARVMGDNHVVAVIHLCADSLVGESMRQPLKYFDNNVGGAISLLKAMQQVGVRALVFSSSAAVYGIQEQMPISETAETRPINPYGLTKLQMEQIILWQTAATPLHAVSLRYFNVAGASRTSKIGEAHSPETHLIPNILMTLLPTSGAAATPAEPLKVFGSDYPTRDGTCVRDYVDVQDLADAHLLTLKIVLSRCGLLGSDPAAQHAAQHVPGSFEIFNIGSESGYTVMEVIQETEQATGLHVPVEIVDRRPGDPPALVASSSKIRSVGWAPEHDLADTVLSACHWHSGE